MIEEYWEETPCPEPRRRVEGSRCRMVEEYWEETRQKWVNAAENPYLSETCGFCRFAADTPGCESCPVFIVYGGNCEVVKPVQAFLAGLAADAPPEELRALAEAVIKELDEKRGELIAAMQEVWGTLSRMPPVRIHLLK